MKTIGLIGGMSWESSLEYYRIINQETRRKLGGLHSAKCLMFSVDFDEVEKLQHLGEWGEAAKILVDAAIRVEGGGADLVVICTNTMHKMADDVQNSIKIPLLHIADATAEKVVERGLRKIGLLGTRFTMEQDFYKGRMIRNHGLDVLVPDEAERLAIHEVIYSELCLGILNDRSRDRLIAIVEKLADNGAEAVVLGCTEIPLLIHQEDVSVPVFDTTRIHAESAVDHALR
jgi:aspartate racemase